MLDPLRSLAELVRTLTRSRSGAARTDAGTASNKTADSAAREQAGELIPEAQALREKLRQRIRLVGTSDRRRAREVFVETVLAAELGERITLDPAMADIVTRVAQQLGADASTDRDLGMLFDELASESA